MGYDTTTNYGIRKPILGTFRNEWPVIWRYGLDQIDAAIHTKFDKAGGTVTGVLASSHATAENNNAGFTNTHANGYGLYSRGGSNSRYAAQFNDKDGNQLMLLSGTGALTVAGSVDVNGQNVTVGTTGGSPASVLVRAAASGTNGGAAAVVQNGFTSIIGVGNKSALLGGAYDATPTIFGASQIYINQGISVDGTLLAGVTSGGHHTLQKDSPNDYATTLTNTSSTSPLGLRVLMTGVSGGAGGAMIACSDNALRFVVYGNGNVQNVNNSYGAISDANLKRDVTDTGPKLSKVLAMRIVNYYLKADPSNTKLLGMIAQELREISPGLVEETPDYEDVIVEPARTDHIPRQRQKTEARTVTKWKVEVRDGVAVRSPVEVVEHVPLFIELPLVGEDGQQIIDVVNGKQVPAVFRQPVMEDYTETVDVPAKIERRATGTVTLSIKYSILVPMLIKAMQELHADFDRRLFALEA